MTAGGVADKLAAAHRDALADPADERLLGTRCQRMAELVRKAGMTPQVREALLAAYHALGDHVVVAVRSSATGEDSRDTSFAA